VGFNDGVLRRLVLLYRLVDDPHPEPDVEHVAAADRAHRKRVRLHQRPLPRHHHCLALGVHHSLLTERDPGLEVALGGGTVGGVRGEGLPPRDGRGRGEGRTWRDRR
jgi:hypothetical protein